MLKTVGTQTNSDEGLYTFSDTNTASHKDLVQPSDLTNKLTIDPFDSQFCSDLREWCKFQWSRTFQNNHHNSNSIYYHECCFSFSRRGFKRQAGYPELQTASVLKIPTFRDINSSEGLFKWLMSRLESSHLRGYKCEFPSINKYHTDDDHSLDEVEDNEEEIGLLRKRCDLLQRENEKVKKSVETISLENKSLLSSSKNWHNRYQELYEKSSDQSLTQFETPLKVKKIYVEESALTISN